MGGARRAGGEGASLRQDELFRWRGGQAGVNRQQGFGLGHDDAAQFIGGGQVLEAPEAEVFQESVGGPVGDGPADDFGATDLRDQSALQQRLHHAVDRDAADLFDLRAGDRLAVSDDRQSFQRREGETRGAALVPDEGLDPGGELRLADELPGAGDASQPIAALGLLMLAGQLGQGGRDRVGRSFPQRLDRGVVGLFGGRGE